MSSEASLDRYSWVLTDLTTGQQQPAGWEISSEHFRDIAPGVPWRIQQRLLTAGRAAGVTLIDVQAGHWHIQVLPTRGMSIWKGWWRGLPLGWQAPILGPVHPSFVNLHDRGGLGWLDGFDEWIVRCGLSHLGPPGSDPATGQQLTLHGRIANQPAHFVEVRVQRSPPFALQVIGHVQETTMFFADFLLQSTVTLWPGRAELVIEDVVLNRRSQPAEMQMLYHCNFGPPLADQGSEVAVRHRRVQPRDATAAAGMETWSTLAGPTPGWTEQVFLFEADADASGEGHAWLRSPRRDLGLHLQWTAASLPYFNLWKNTVPLSDGYVVGLEPATSYPLFKDLERQAGRVVLLGPGASWQARLQLRVLEASELTSLRS